MLVTILQALMRQAQLVFARRNEGIQERGVRESLGVPGDLDRVLIDERKIRLRFCWDLRKSATYGAFGEANLLIAFVSSRKRKAPVNAPRP